MTAKMITHHACRVQKSTVRKTDDLNMAPPIAGLTRLALHTTGAIAAGPLRCVLQANY
jgi:hypothetical protein